MVGIELQPIVNNGHSLVNDFIFHPGDSMTFTFNNPVVYYVVGIWGFQLIFPKQDWGIQEASIWLDATPNGNEVDVVVNATLTDGGGHVLDPSASMILPVCLAVTGSTSSIDSTTMMEMVGTIANGAVVDGLQPPIRGTAPSVSAACLSGFDLRYSNAVRNMNGMEVGCSYSSGGDGGRISANAAMWDSQHHTADIATVDAGYMVSTQAKPGFQAKQVGPIQTGQPVSVTMDKLQSVSQAAVMIQDWKVRYDRDHNVRGIAAAYWGNLSISGTTVTFPQFMAMMWDSNFNHGQDNTVDFSSVTANVIALP